MRQTLDTRFPVQTAALISTSLLTISPISSESKYNIYRRKKHIKRKRKNYIWSYLEEGKTEKKRKSKYGISSVSIQLGKTGTRIQTFDSPH